MPDPFDMPDAAFEPFYHDRIAFEVTRPDGIHRGTVPACIFDEGYADVFDSETGLSSSISRLVINVRKRDWSAALSTPPQQGDRFTSPATGKTYALTRANHFTADTWTIDAREVSP